MPRQHFDATGAGNSMQATTAPTTAAQGSATRMRCTIARRRLMIREWYMCALPSWCHRVGGAGPVYFGLLALGCARS